MILSDFLVTPLYLIILFIIFNVFSLKYKDNPQFKRYFVYAFLSRILGGLAFAFIYLFYYKGGDTLSYYSDSLVIREIISNDFAEGLQFLFTEDYVNTNFSFYAGSIYFLHDPPSLTIGKIGGVFNLITVNSYLCDTILFSLFGFLGSWKLFITLQKIYPSITKHLAFACLFIPSVIFWGSGMMKDTLCIALLSYIFSYAVEIFVFKQPRFTRIILLILFSLLLIKIKIYIFMSFLLPVALLVAIYAANSFKSILLRVLIIYPSLVTITVGSSYYVLDVISQENSNYNLDKIEETAKMTSDYIGRISLQTDGSYYSLGELDFSLSNLPTLFYKAFVVTFYRPFIWEIKNPLMLLSSLEGAFFLYITFVFIRYILLHGSKVRFTPFIIFCFLFCSIFAFIVGVTSSNFGTLARYKIPALPFYLCAIYIIVNDAKSKLKNF